jgi:teichuronic acid biosynthesis glycosyltransferase TuaC
MLRILFLSGLYSTPRAPWLGLPNARIVHELRSHAAVKVVAPLPYYPGLLRSKPHIRALSEIPALDEDDDGSIVHRPRRLHVPGLYAAQAALYFASVALPVRRVVGDFRPDVVLSAWAYPDGTTAVALAGWLGLPCVVRTMGSDINDWAQKSGRRFQIRWALRRADRVIAVSAALGREVEKLGVSRGRIRVIPTGVDPELFYPMDRSEARVELGLGEQRPLIVVPSRLSREKGVHYFLEALKRLDPSVMSIVVGDGDQQHALRSQAERLGITDRVLFAGFQPQERMRLYYAAADVTCLASTEEGWPNVLVESLACGCPVVASDVGGVHEIIALTGDGILVPPADPERLCTALQDALSRVWNRQATVDRMREHTIRITAERYLQTCASALEKRTP